MLFSKIKVSSALMVVSLLWLLVTNAGDLGVLDTELRLDMSHAWWTNQSEITVPPNTPIKVRGDIRFGVIGRDGERYIAYEEGQSLLMLPGDFIGTQLFQLFPVISQADWRQLATSFFVFIPLNLAVVMASNYLLKLFDFTEKIAALGSLLLLLGTTVLHHAQVHQQNNQILLLVILGYATALQYVKTRDTKHLLLSGLAIGGAVLLRITCILHGLTVFLFLISCIFYQNRKWQSIIKPTLYWLLGLIPFSLLGRIFAYFRYGSIFLSAKKVEQLQLDNDPLWEGMPSLPDNYPLVNSPLIGILGPIFHPGKSLFIYDPLLFPSLIIGIREWRKFNPYIQLYLIANILNLALHFTAYSRFVFWHGDSAWASRYHVTSVHLLIIPLLGYFLEAMLTRQNWQRWLIKGLIILSIIVQLASTALPFNLELFQKQVGVPGSKYDLRIINRINNIACYFVPTLNPYCSSQYPNLQKKLEPFYHFRYFPFNYQFKYQDSPQTQSLLTIMIVLWFVTLVLTLLSTFCFLRLLAVV
jgi:hypothetical protein